MTPHVHTRQRTLDACCNADKAQLDQNSSQELRLPKTASVIYRYHDREFESKRSNDFDFKFLMRFLFSDTKYVMFFGNNSSHHFMTRSLLFVVFVLGDVGQGFCVCCFSKMQSGFQVLVGSLGKRGMNCRCLLVIFYVAQSCLLSIKEIVHTAIPIYAPTPAPTALTIKIAVRPAIVIVVTPSTLEKTARSPGENNRPTLTTTVTLTAAQAFAQTSTVSASCPSMLCGQVLELMAGTLYTGS